jgi:hypothetical protein
MAARAIRNAEKARACLRYAVSPRSQCSAWQLSASDANYLQKNLAQENRSQEFALAAPFLHVFPASRENIMQRCAGKIGRGAWIKRSRTQIRNNTNTPCFSARDMKEDQTKANLKIAVHRRFLRPKKSPRATSRPEPQRSGFASSRPAPCSKERVRLTTHSSRCFIDTSSPRQA